MDEKMKKLIRKCLNSFKGMYSQQQALNITLGVAAILWMELDEKYKYASRSIIDSLNFEDPYLEYKVKDLEREFLELDGILSTLFNKSFIDNGKYIKEIYWLLKNKDLMFKEDYKRLINLAVGQGLESKSFNETPKSVASLVAKLHNLNDVERFADFCSGISNIALEIFSKTDHNPYYYGEEMNTNVSVISKLLMIVNEVKNYKIENKDIFSKDELYWERQFDLVLCDIPRASNYNREFSYNNPIFRYGVPGKGNPEWAYIQNVIYHLNERGKGIAIGSKGMLARGYEKEIRSRIIMDDLIECVITLPDNLYEGTNIGTEVVILNKNKSIDRRDKILFINAHQYRERLNNHQHKLSEEGKEKILESYYNFTDEEGFSKIIPIGKTKEYDFRLNPVEYIDFEALKNKFDETITLDNIAEISRGVDITKKELEQLKAEDGYYYLSIRNIEEDGINYNDAEKIGLQGKDWVEKYSIEADDILITTKGWETKTTIVSTDFKKSLFSGNLTRLRVDRRKYNPYILLEFLQSETGKRMLQSIQTGTTITLINNKQLSRMEIPVYPKTVMEDVGQAIEENQKTFKKRVREAEEEYKEKKAKLIKKLSLNNSL